MTAPVSAEGAVQETVTEPLSVLLLWVIALCNDMIKFHSFHSFYIYIYNYAVLGIILYQVDTYMLWRERPACALDSGLPMILTTYTWSAAWAESCIRRRAPKSTHTRGAISCKPALDKESPELWIVASSRESHCMEDQGTESGINTCTKRDDLNAPHA